MSITKKTNNEELFSHKIISLDEKIQILERFLQNDEKLVGSTIFEGYPIGQWAIKIRNMLNNGKVQNFTSEQLKRLENLGILEKQKCISIDTKIDNLVKWRLKYPEATIKPIVSSEILSKYAKTEEELKQLMEEYEKIQEYYNYVRIRRAYGKLKDEQIIKCIEGNVGGVFVKNTQDKDLIEVEKKELIEKYGLDEKTINFIIKKYGNIDKFRKTYINALINKNIDEVIPKRILDNINLVRKFDLNAPDLVLRSNRLLDFIYNDSNERNIFIKYDGLEEKFIEIIKRGNFTEIEKNMLFMLYGLNGEERLNQSQIARKLGRKISRTQQIISKAIRKVMIRTHKQLDLENRTFDIDYDFHKKIIEEYLENFDIFISKEPENIDEDVKNKIINMFNDGVEKTKKRKEQIEIINKMSMNKKIEILKRKFGEKINSSDFSVIPPCCTLYKFFEENDGLYINEMLIDGYDIPGFCNIYKECLDSEYVQSIIAEFIVKKSDNSQLTKLGKKEELEEIIENNIYFSEEKKDNLKKILAERMRFAVKEKIFKEITDFIPSTTLKSIEEISLEQLDLQIHSLNRLRKSGINLVKQLIGKTEEDLMKIEDLTSGNIEDIIEKIQSCGVEIIDGHLEVTKPELSIEEQIEEEINSSDVLMEDEKEMLREYLGKKSLKMNVEEKSSLLGIEVNVDSSEISKEDFVNNILEKQKIVANQYKEITKISLKKNEK